jgi:acid phosphatase family membrane protein YuiD
MDFFTGIANNEPLWAAITAYIVASFLKVLVKFIKTRKLKPSLFISTGGMPSSHSAFIASAAASVGFTEGFDSSVFALAAVISIVVMYDAQGVRRASGKQAEAINRIIANFDNLHSVLERELKEILGHTPFEVFAGAGLGILIAWVFNR